MMFHVEPSVSTCFPKRSILLGLTLVLLNSCVLGRQTMQITDYILVPNGKEVLGSKGLTSFIFENNITKIPIEQYLSTRLKSDNYLQKEYCVTIEQEKYKIIIYDNAEFEKYFDSSHYAVKNEQPENSKNGDSRKFIAISMINSFNEDCLAQDSLFQNIAVTYLKKLKDEYYNQ